MSNKTDAGNGSKAICRVSNVHPSPSPDPKRSAEDMISAPLMLVASIIGLFGIVYVALRHFVAHDDRKSGWPLLYSFILAPLFVAVGLNAIGKAMKSDLHPEVWAAATVPIFSIALFCTWLVTIIKNRNEKK